ncbi:MAG TPA: hypothetical protein VGJ83_06720 [Gemmatimonadales bacterium]|jgi:hypothetical protein
MRRPRAVLIVLGAVAVAGFAALQFARPAGPEHGVGAVCRQRAGEERRTCYIRVLAGYLNTYGVARAVATLDSLAAADSEVAQHAHEYAHGLGFLAYARSPDITSAFVSCGDGSASGCRHGFMQAYFQSRSRITAAEVRALCRPLEAATYNRALLFQCLHGEGHGLTMFHGHDAPRALAGCDLLAAEWGRVSCYGGVFMEAFVNATAPHDPAAMPAHHHASAYKAIDPADPLYPCSIMARRYLRACYQFQTTVMLHLNGGDIPAAARVCDRAPADMRMPCYESLGRDVTTYAARDPGKSAQLCATGSEPYRPACYVGAVQALVNWTGTTDQALEMCRVAAAGEAGGIDARSCYAGVGIAITTIFPRREDWERQCARAAEPAAVEACRRGAGLR